MNIKQLNKNKQEINESFTSLFGNVDNLIAEMKLTSSEEILNGSVVEAQKLLGQILPYQTFYEKLREAKNVFDEISGISKEDIKNVKEKIEALDQEEVNNEIVEANQESEITSQINFRVPILQKINRFPKILLEWDGEKGELPTSDKTYIWVDTFALWKIKDPFLFFQTCRNNIESGVRAKGKFTYSLFKAGLKIAYNYNGIGWDRGKGLKVFLKPSNI